MRTLLLLFILLSSHVYAGILDIMSIKSRFEQYITNEQGKVITYKGEVFAKREGSRALWKYVSPINKSIYFSKDAVVMIEPELEQAIVTKLHKAPNILKIFKEAKKIEANLYEATCCDYHYRISFEANKIKNIAYRDKLGNDIVITFVNAIQNQWVDDQTFHYVIPADYDLIEE
jgi:outer membrane lipoprotein carrier protein